MKAQWNPTSLNDVLDDLQPVAKVASAQTCGMMLVLVILVKLDLDGCNRSMVSMSA